MFGIPDRIKGIYHPSVEQMYVKKDYSNTLKSYEEVLVIEAHGEDMDDNAEHDGFDTHLIDILGDLDRLKKQVERKCGSIDRIDIRTH